MAPADDPRPVPWRTIWATIGSVLVAAAAVVVIQELQRVLVWIVVAAFLAVVLNPIVNLLVHRAHMRRGLATSVTFLVAILLVAGMGYLFVRPLVTAGQSVAHDLPDLVNEARAGRGPVGGLVRRFDLDTRLSEQADQLQGNIDQIGSQSMKVVGAVGSAVVGTLTVLVLTFLMLLEAPRLINAGLGHLPEHRRNRIQAVADDCGKAITGYMAGNVLISLIAGVLTYIFLWIAGVPFKEVIAVFVAVVDLIPLVGATIGAVVASAVGFLHSPLTGVATLVFFVVYQQAENHLLQPGIQARTVKLSPLVVLVSALIGVDMAGLLGALLAIPVAGVLKVIIRDVWDNRRGALKPEPTVGGDETPVSSAGARPAIEPTG